MYFISQENVARSLEFLNLDQIKKLDVSKVITKFIKGDIQNVERITAKNNVLINLFETENFDFETEIPIKDKCIECKGRGFDIISFKAELQTCPTCNGTCYKIAKCTKCDGTGKIGEIKCGTCHGRGTYIYKETDHYSGKKCLDCRGTGKIKVLIPRDSKIKEVHVCSSCKGTGISTFRNSILNKQLATEIKEKLLSK